MLGISRNKFRKADPERFFNTDHLKADLKGHTVRGGAITVAAQASRFVIRMGSTVVLARLLAPEDYGLLGMVTVVTGFVELFKDLGLSAATIQRSQINHQQASTLFWINIAMGCTIAVIVAAMAPLIAWFYQEPLLTKITLVLASNFIISAFGNQHQALLKRQMRFDSLAKIEILSMLVSVLTAITLARYGFGYWALVFMQSASAITITLGAWIVCSWRPGLPALNSGIRSMLAFGGNLTAFRSVNYFSRNLDNILIGRIWGPQQLGLYSKAYQLLLLPIHQINTPVNNVALSALSSLQLEPKRYRSFYCKAILIITTLGMPIVAFMFVSADKVILALLGQQWLSVVPIFRFLMPAAFVGTFNVATGWVYQSLGRTDRQFRWGMISSFINVVIFFVSVRWGAIGVAAAYGISQPFLQVPALIYCYRGTPIQISDLLSALHKPALASIGAATALIGINQIIPSNIHIAVALFQTCLLYGLFYIAMWLVLPNGKQTLIEMLQMTKNFKRKKR